MEVVDWLVNYGDDPEFYKESRKEMGLPFTTPKLSDLAEDYFVAFKDLVELAGGQVGLQDVYYYQLLFPVPNKRLFARLAMKLQKRFLKGSEQRTEKAKDLKGTLQAKLRGKLGGHRP